MPVETRRRPAEVRQLLLDAAVRVFRDKGYNRATNDEIAAAAGVSASVFFRHFRTKGELFREALVQPFVDSLAAFTQTWQRSFQDPVDERQIMRSFISDIYDNLATHEEAVKGLVATEGALDPEVAADVVALLNQIFAQFQEMGAKEAARRGGWFPGEDMELTARLILGMIAATVTYRPWFLPTGRNRISRRRLIERMSDLMLYGIRLEPAPRQIPVAADLETPQETQRESAG